MDEWKRENRTTSIYFRPKYSSSIDDNTSENSKCETNVKQKSKSSQNSLLFVYQEHCAKSVRIRSFFFWYRCIQSECGKVRTRENSAFGHFSRSGALAKKIITTLYERVGNLGFDKWNNALRSAVILFSGKSKCRLPNCPSIISENESEESITKALQILKQWHPEFKPK